MNSTASVNERLDSGLPQSFDVQAVRRDFPILNRQVHGKGLVYLDNAATTQKPQAVIDAIAGYYTTINSNVHRGVHFLSQEATELYERSRERVRRFINAASDREIIFVRGTTEAVNVVAHGVQQRLKPGDEIIISTMEHHSNIVPWQMACAKTGAVLRVIPINDEGEILFEEFEKLLGPKTKFVSVVYVSNSMGTINPVKRIIEKAHEHGVEVFIDGAQAVQHIKVDVQDLDCDYFAFSGHKMYAPMGIGVLFGKAALLEELPPYQGGGEMILSVSFEETTFNEIPHKLEAGTPNVQGACGLAAAIEYLTTLGLKRIEEYEDELLEYATDQLSRIPGLRIVGTAREKCSVVSFVLEGIHPHDIGTILDQEGIAIRTGHHCTQPLMERYGLPATARVSIGLYNTRNEIDRTVSAIRKVQEVFADVVA